jgi:hypothetical protein
MYCDIIIIKPPKKLLEHVKCKLTFSNTLFEKYNNDVCLADAFLVYCDSDNQRSTVN